jgi:rRNA maturation endonuclease Nob1
MSDEFLSHEVTHIELRETANTAARQSESNDDRLDKLELTVKNLSVINEALYEILVSKININAIDLAVMIDQVTVNRENRLNAKSTCSSCSRLVPSNKQKCMYCGGELLGEIKISPFDQ